MDVLIPIVMAATSLLILVLIIAPSCCEQDRGIRYSDLRRPVA